MAIFTDSNGKHLIGIIYSRSGDRYSGNFVAVHPRQVKFITAVLPSLARFLLVLGSVCLLANISKLVVGDEESFNYFFAAISMVGCVVAVACLVVGPIMVSRTKVRLRDVVLECNERLSRQMYIAAFLDIALILVSVLSMPAISFAADGMFALITLGPILGALAFAVRNHPAS